MPSDSPAAPPPSSRAPVPCAPRARRRLTHEPRGCIRAIRAAPQPARRAARAAPPRPPRRPRRRGGRRGFCASSRRRRTRRRRRRRGAGRPAGGRFARGARGSLSPTHNDVDATDRGSATRAWGAGTRGTQHAGGAGGTKFRPSTHRQSRHTSAAGAGAVRECTRVAGGRGTDRGYDVRAWGARRAAHTAPAGAGDAKFRARTPVASHISRRATRLQDVRGGVQDARARASTFRASLEPQRSRRAQHRGIATTSASVVAAVVGDGDGQRLLQLVGCVVVPVRRRCSDDVALPLPTSTRSAATHGRVRRRVEEESAGGGHARRSAAADAPALRQLIGVKVRVSFFAPRSFSSNQRSEQKSAASSAEPTVASSWPGLATTSKRPTRGRFRRAASSSTCPIISHAATAVAAPHPLQQVWPEPVHGVAQRRSGMVARLRLRPLASVNRNARHPDDHTK